LPSDIFLWVALGSVALIWMAKIAATKIRRGADLRAESEKLDQMSRDSFPTSDPPHLGLVLLNK
jgi:hypothetical protein